MTYFNIRTMVTDKMRRLYPDDDDVTSRMEAEVRFMSSFKFFWCMVRMEISRLSMTAEQGMCKTYLVKFSP